MNDTADATSTRQPVAKLVMRTDVVKQRMREYGLTGEQLADLTGVSYSTVKRSFAGHDPSTAFLAGLWTRLELSPNQATRPVDFAPSEQTVVSEAPYPTLPVPDAENPDHADFVRDWFGQVDDLQIAGGRRSVELYSGADVGEFVRERVLDLVDRIERHQARRDELVVALAKSRLHPGDVLEVADLILSQFEVTPKSGAD